ncbi:MAG: hypothetical protein OEY79_01015 [Anaplasmataceae bacterium]|nr:hypothetical protein [Anaplasmataceae bacterium]
MIKFFGTDGIRGIFNKEPITEKFFKNISLSLVYLIKNKSLSPKIVIGYDTRSTSLVLKNAIIENFIQHGIDVKDYSYTTTSSIAFLSKDTNISFGIMITASHNDAEYNGIKIFNNQGFKISDILENEIEEVLYKIINNKFDEISIQSRYIGKYIINTLESYNQYLFNYFKNTIDYSNEIIIDLANGSACFVIEKIRKHFNLNLKYIHNNPNGININKECGVLSHNSLSQMIIKNNANFGIAFDGDADRILFIDNKGMPIDNDQILGLFVFELLQENKLQIGDTVIGTEVSSFGLEKYINILGLKFKRTKIGDKHVINEIINNPRSVGGEKSGHLIISHDYLTSDGIFTFLMILKLLTKYNNKSLREISDKFTVMPRIEYNISYENQVNLDDKSFIESVKKLKNDYNALIIIRKSGTENVIRIVIESKNNKINNIILKKLITAYNGLIAKQSANPYLLYQA